MARSISTVAFFTDYEDQSTDDQLVIPEDLSELSLDEVTELHDKAAQAFLALRGDGTGYTPEDVESLKELGAGIKKLQTRKTELEAKAKELAEEVDSFAAELNLEFSDDDTETVPEEDDSDEEVADDEPEAGEEELAAEEEVVASGEIRVDMSRVKQRKKAQVVPAAKSMRDVVFSAKGGQGMDRMDIAKAVDKQLNGFNLNAYKAAARSGKKMSERFPIATFNRSFSKELIITGENADDAIKAAVDQSRLPQGSLVASGGWCAPSETLYDLCNISEAADLITLPEVQVNRGGINHTVGPDYSTVYGDTGFCYTEEEDIDGDYDGAGGGTKPCFHLECPEFTDDRLGYCGVCITAGLMQARGYPEALANLIDLAMTAHAHRVSASVINTLVSKSTAVAWPANQKGAVAPLLTAIDLQAMHYRAVNRMSSNAALEVVLPTWTKAIVRADLARRQGVDLLDVPEARMNAWFAARNVAAQFVVDWQDIATTPASGFTSADSSVDFLLYAAGTFVKGVTESITLENIYDSVGLGTNDFTALFTEDPYLVAKRCHDSRVVSVPICPDGATHIGIDIACDGS